MADTKLARHVKASAILQVCSYVEQLTAIQGRQPEFLYVALGGSARPTDRRRVDDFMAYYRRVKREFEEAVGIRGEAAARWRTRPSARTRSPSSTAPCAAGARSARPGVARTTT